MKKKLKWKKKRCEDFEYWMAEGPVGWEFTIEENDGRYELYVYFGSGDDSPLCEHMFECKSLKDAKKQCEKWLFNMIVELNKWL